MDPLEDLCKERSFGEFYDQEKSIINLDWLVFVNDTDIKFKKTKRVDSPLNTVSVSNPNFDLSKMGTSIFKNKSSMVMADIDTVFNITPAIGGFYNLRDPTKGYNYVDMDFEFVEYLQFREIYSIGYILVKDKDKITDITLDWSRIMLHEDPDTFIEFVLKQVKDVKLFICSSNYSDVVTGLQLIKPEDDEDTEKGSEGGNMIIRLNEIDPNIIYLLSQCFEKITLYKPIITSNIYLICIRMRSKVHIDRILKLFKQYNEKKYNIKTPKEYDTWLSNIINITNKIQSLDDGKKNKHYDLHRALIAMHLPGNIIPKSSPLYIDKESLIKPLTNVQPKTIKNIVKVEELVTDIKPEQEETTIVTELEQEGVTIIPTSKLTLPHIPELDRAFKEPIIFLTDKILKDKKMKIPYYTDSPEIYTNFNPHWGQLKLLLNEIYFITKVLKEYPDALFVYVGAASGLHHNITKYLFPGVQFVLYDTNKFEIDHPDYKIESRYFLDEEVDYIKKLANGREIAFISDIRTTAAADSEDQHGIWKEMLMQQKWVVLLNSCYYMLKFRLPFTKEPLGSKLKEPKGSEIDVFDFDDSITKYVSNKSILSAELYEDDVIYLDGDVMLQPYGPARTTETRLIGKRKNKDKYMFRIYNYTDYESTLNWYNLKIRRSEEYAYEDSKYLQYAIMGFRNTMDEVLYYYIIDYYIKNRHPESNAIELINNINNSMIYYTGRYLPFIAIEDLLKENKYKQREIKHLKGDKTINDYKKNIVELLNKGFEYLSKYKILSKEQRIAQMKILKYYKSRSIEVEIDKSKNIIVHYTSNLKKKSRV